MESVLCWPTISGHGACPGVLLIYPKTLHLRKWIFPSQQVSLTNSFLLRGGNLCLLLLLSARTSYADFW